MTYIKEYRYSGNFLELLNSIYNSINELNTKELIVLITYFIDSSLGSDLEQLGKLVGITKDDQETDDSFRVRIKTFVAGYNLQPTKAGYEFLGQQLIGVTPTIYEYPDIDFTPLFGKPYPGLLISFTPDQINPDTSAIGNFRSFAKAYKAAGIPMLVGTLKQLSETYLELLSDFWSYKMKFNYNEFTNPVLMNGLWDTTNWDESSWDNKVDFWDGNFYIRPESRFIDNILESSLIDDMLKNEKYFFSDSYLENLLDSLDQVKVGMFESVSNILKVGSGTIGVLGGTIGNPISDLEKITGSLYINDSLLILDPMQIYHIGHLYIIEQYLLNIVTTMLFDGNLFISENVLNLLDSILLNVYKELTENNFTGSSSGSSSSSSLIILKVGSGTIGSNGGAIGTGSITILNITESYS